MNKKIVILGCSGSGKDHLMNKLVQKGLKHCIKCTTRPIRKFEQHGITYNYISNDEFKNLIDDNKFIAYQSFEVTPVDSEKTTWYYGITLDEFYNKDVLIMTPFELNSLSDELRNQCYVIYLNIPRDIREKRISKRNDKNDSIQRRLDSDDKDFSIKINYNLCITNPNFIVDEIYDLYKKES